MKSSGKKLWLSSTAAKIALIAIIAFAAGYLLKSLSQQQPTGAEHEHPDEQIVAQKWYCSMDTQIIRDGPGKCPLCGMDLVPMPTESDAGPRELVVSEEAAKLMEIETSTVERKFVTAEIQMVGKIDYDETRVKHITAWVPGRIDRLYVDFTGITVSKGDHMVYLYSPELLSAQAELLQAVKAVENFKAGSSELIRRSILATLEAAREKLRLLGLTKNQIEEIEKTKEVVDHITIYAPMGGVVIEKHRTEGTYVDTGTQIYMIADLSHLWVKLDAYESDMMWIRYGQVVEFITEAYPGEAFSGKISFINPMLDAKTRTVKLRVNVDNPEGKLKPEMFVKAIVRSKVALGGRVMAPEMAGKWICPMHPDIVETKAGSCNICGMDLVTTESLGYVKVDAAGAAPLVIPASAALITGKRAVVYVRQTDADKPTYEGREVVLGPRAGDYYIVKSGLEEGEIVVTNGNFKIDSAMQIQAKPSMMSAERDKTIIEHQHAKSEHKYEIFEVPDEYRKQLWGVVHKYFSLQDALAGDDKHAAAQAAGETLEALSAVDMSLVSGKAHNVWMDNSMKMKAALNKIKEAVEIELMREGFERLSSGIIAMAEQFGVYRAKTLYKFNCPMAFDNKGANWLQMDKDTRNPYFGASMLKCGQVIEVIGGKTK
ncbi:MAG: efflux RND transporter periplasmic adaptor subunit [Planctomycetota bacterium]